MSGEMMQPQKKEGPMSDNESLYNESDFESQNFEQIPESFEGDSYDENETHDYSLDQPVEDEINDYGYENDYDEIPEESFESEDYSEQENYEDSNDNLEENNDEYVTEENSDNSNSDFDEIPEESFDSDESSEDYLLNEEYNQENEYDNESFDEIPEESYDTENSESNEYSDQDNYDQEENTELNYDELPEESFESEEYSEQETNEEYVYDPEDLENVEEDPLKDHSVVAIETEEESQLPEPENPKLNVEDVQNEIHHPVQLENTANYLMNIPILGQVVKEKYLENIKKETDDVKLRAIRVATQKEIIAQFKEQKQPYIITHFTGQENLCTVDKNCLHKVFKSVYYEVSNPVTNKNVMLTSHMFHNMTRHHMVYFNEPLLNLGNSPQGFFDSYLPCADLMTALKDSNVPQEVIDELNAVKEKIEFLEYERFAAVRGNVQYDMSVFEQTEYEKEHNIIPFYALLRTLVEWGAEDIHIKAGFRPMGVLGGDVKPCPQFPEFLSGERTKYYSSYLLTEPQIQQFEETLEMDNSFYVPGVARFRCNMYHSQGNVGMVFRVIPTKIRPVEVLGVPLILKKLVFERLGLVLVTGQTGSGKTTTLAAIVEFCNVNRAIHILTLENPVEYVYESKKSIFTQRAIEIDSLSFPMAMRGALRQKPDIILIGEMRDPDTIMAGLKAAETGHLVMSTLHTNDAVQTINRIVNTFPPHEQETIRVQVGSTIKACVAQRLIPRFDKPGRVCSIEVMLVTPNARGQNTRGYIIRNEVPELYKVVATSGYDGMQSMNMALFEHYKNGVITPDDALSYSDNPDEVTRWMREDMGLGASV